jgi:hypothetical protein
MELVSGDAGVAVHCSSERSRIANMLRSVKVTFGAACTCPHSRSCAFDERLVWNGESVCAEQALHEIGEPPGACSRQMPALQTRGWTTGGERRN